MALILKQLRMPSGRMVSNLNIYDFFNSPDVAEYCQSIGHTFNAVESAVMVNNSNSRTFAEKMAAFRTIIAEYPDMELPRGNNHEYHKSFHKALEDLIVYEERVYEKFMAVESNTVYQASFREEGDDGEDFSYERNIFSSYEKSLADAVKHANETYAPENTQKDGKLGSCSLIRISIRKIYIDSSDKWGHSVYVDVEISQSGEIMNVGNHYEVDIPKENGIDPWLLSIYIDVPVPFKRGDLVEMDGCSPQGNVFVLLDICRDDAELNTKSLYREDKDDMIAGIHYERNGSVHCEVTHFYPDLKYFRGELKGELRILKYVSLHMQDKLCLCSLLKIQKLLMLEKLYKDCKDDSYLEGDLERLGDNLLN